MTRACSCCWTAPAPPACSPGCRRGCSRAEWGWPRRGPGRGNSWLTKARGDAAGRVDHLEGRKRGPMPISRFNPQEALICAMVLMGASDRRMSDAELGMMSRLVQSLPVFSDFHPNGIASVTEICLRLLERDDG